MYNSQYMCWIYKGLYDIGREMFLGNIFSFNSLKQF